MLEVPFESLGGPKLLPIRNHVDSRGSFTKLYEEDLLELSMPKEISISVSRNSHSGTVRGIHFQLPPYSESKLITCLSGEIFDVIVDLRDASPTYKNWAKIELDSNCLQQLYVPEGFAHGYQTLKSNTEIIYVISGRYSATHSRRINFQDRELAINWPLDITDISVADREASSLSSLLDELT